MGALRQLDFLMDNIMDEPTEDKNSTHSFQELCKKSEPPNKIPSADLHKWKYESIIIQTFWKPLEQEMIYLKAKMSCYWIQKTTLIFSRSIANNGLEP